jgi:SAM-dependent methyltransferase
MAQYDVVAEAYASRIAPKYEPIATLVVDHLPEGFRGVTVEPGIGTGLLTGLALPHLFGCSEFIGVDVSPGMLTVARRSLPDWVTLVEASASNMPIPDQRADLIISSLGPVQETDEFFAEAIRVLAPGSPIILTCWGEDYRELELLQQARHRLGAGSYPTGVRQAIHDRATRVGLVDVEIETVRLPVVHNSLDDYIAYRQSFGRMPWLPEDADGEWEALLREAAGRYVTSSGEVALDWTILVLTGRRDR